MPFRSEDEQIREQIRRVEEEAREVVEERAALEQQVASESLRSREPFPEPRRPVPPCMCQLGDPLCSCL